MSWLAPWALAAAAAAAIAIGLLHLLARDRPARWLLPTTRFVAPGSARATRRARTPRDLLLLALRVLALVLAGAAFAGPVLAPEGGSVARVVVLDLSPAVADRAAATQAARARLRAGDRLVVFDTAVLPVAAGRELATLDSLARLRPDTAHVRGEAEGALSAGLVAALRAAAGAAANADSVALVLVSPLVGVADRASAAIRDAWPGRIELVTMPAPMDAPDTSWRVAVRGAPGDAVVVAARLAGAAPDGGAATDTSATLLVRGAPTAADSAFARAGGTLVLWPVAATDAARPDSIGGFVVGGAAGLFAATRAAPPPAGRVRARWVDGMPAVTDARLGAGCIRHVAIAVPTSGDLTLRPAFQRALHALVQPCAARPLAPAADSLRAVFARPGPLATAAALRGDRASSAATPWLLAAALLLLLLEPLLRRGARPVDGTGAPA